jgi:RNA polymerase sigma factor (sigma-70 family)
MAGCAELSHRYSRGVSDEDLLRAWQGGDRAAGDQLLARHFDSVCRFFRSKLGDDVEDLIQRTFLDCVESRDHIRDGGFRPFLFAVARNRLFDHLRKKLARPQPIDLGEISVEDLGTTPSQHVARNQRQALLLRALRQVPLDQQIAIELAYWEDLDGPAIAQVLGIPPNTVRSRLARAREALRDQVVKLSPTPALAEASLAALGKDQ